MIDASQSGFGRMPSTITGLRVDTLITMRWITVVGQVVALAIATWGFGLEVPVIACAIVIGTAAAVNIAQMASRRRFEQRISQGAAVGFLSFDTVQLAALLCLTGGLENPFAFLCLAPVTVAASTLGLGATLAVGSLAIACLVVVGALHLPLPWRPGESVILPPLYVVGMSAALICSLGFLTYYAWRVAKESKRTQDALTTTERALARETQLAALDGMAAAAAHDLGSPLSTISVVARELNREFADNAAVAEDLALLQSEADRCRKILADLTRRASDALHAKLSLAEILDQVAAPHRGGAATIDVRLVAPEAGDSMPVFAHNPGILFALGTLVENATEHAGSHVWISGGWDNARVVVEIADDGPGIAADILARLGEPFISSRKPVKHRRAAGSGIGVFIAETLIERSGGAISFSNLERPATGAVVTVAWPRGSVDVADKFVTVKR